MSNDVQHDSTSHEQNQEDIPVLDISRVSAVHKSGHSIGLVLWFILLVIILGLSFFGWQQITALKLQFAKNAQDLSQVPLTQASINQQMQILNQTVNQQQRQLSIAQDSLVRINSLVTNNQTGWLLIETQHLLQLANLSLKFEHNIPVSITLLTLADQRLFMIGDPALAEVRQLLASNLVALRAMTPLDQEGIYLKLDALRDQSIHLPMVSKEYAPTRDMNMLSQIKTGLHPSVWERSETTIGQALSKILIIRHRSTPLQPLLEPNQENILKQNLYWLYSQAQWAVLHRQAVVYQNCLTQITQLVNTYFQLNPNVQSILQSLSELQKIDVNAAMPDIDATLAAMQNYTKSHQQKMIETQTIDVNADNKVPAISTPSQDALPLMSTSPKKIPSADQPLITPPKEEVVPATKAEII